MAVRIRCTTQVCTVDWGQVASMASGKPVNPSQQGVSFHLCKSGVVQYRTAVGADRRSVL